MIDKWRKGHALDLADFVLLTPDEAEQVAFGAGYNTNSELHKSIRDGCRNSAGKTD